VTDGLDPEGIEASMSDGVLMMRLPEPAQTQPRRIQIRPSTATGNGAGMQAEAEGDPRDSAPPPTAPQERPPDRRLRGRPLPCLLPHTTRGGPEDRV
jgi:hypothetical protein